MSTTKDHNRGFDNGVLGGKQQRILGLMAEQHGYDVGRAIFDANHTTGGAAATSYSPALKKQLWSVNPRTNDYTI